MLTSACCVHSGSIERKKKVYEMLYVSCTIVPDAFKSVGKLQLRYSYYTYITKYKKKSFSLEWNMNAR